MNDGCATCGHARKEHVGPNGRCSHFDEVEPTRVGDEVFDLCMCTQFQEKARP